MGLLQFFGVITALDCTDDLIAAGLIGALLGSFIGGVIVHLIQKLE